MVEKPHLHPREMLGLWFLEVTKWAWTPGQVTSVRSPEKQWTARHSKEEF